MKKKIEVTAKKVADAIAEGLKILQLTIDDVDVKILSSGGFFKKAQVELYYGEDIPEVVVAPEVKTQKPAEKPIEKQAEKSQKVADKPIEKQADKTQKPIEKPIEKTQKPIDKPIEKPKTDKVAETKSETKKMEVVDRTEKNGKHYRTHESSTPTQEQVDAGKKYLQDVVKLMRVDGVVESTVNDGIDYNIVTENSKIIGYRGEVLDALQYLASLKVNEINDKYVRVKLDGLDYRAKRKGILENLALKLADKCVRTGKRVNVEAMDSMDRRIIHARLADREDVITKSEGKEPNRRVVIYARSKKD